MGSVLYKSCKKKIKSFFSFLFIGLIFKPLGVSRSRIPASAGKPLNTVLPLVNYFRAV